MLILLAFVLYVSGINTQSSGHETAKAATDCFLPPHPKNGHYEVLAPEMSNLKPGAKLSNFTLQVTCNPEYHLTDSLIYWCENGEILGSAQQMPECLPYCSAVRDNVLSCGLGNKDQESRCLVPDNFYNVNVRGGSMDEELECGSTGIQTLQIVSGGRIVEKKELPWHAGIYSKTKQPYMQICGGSLVSQTVVISAAHCFWNDVEKLLPAHNYAVAVGKIYRPWNNARDEYAQKSDVAEIKVPPRFQGSTTNLQDDIALVIVTSPFEYMAGVGPVCLDFNTKLDEKQLAPGVLGKVAGWGLTSDNGQQSPVLKVAKMPYVDITECIEKSDPTFKVHITSDKICAGYRNGTAVCRGDSGGGLSFPETIRGIKRYFLRGVTSAAPRNENLCNTLAWATFTHVLKHEHFIRKTVPATSSSPSTMDQPLSPFLQTGYKPIDRIYRQTEG